MAILYKCGKCGGEAEWLVDIVRTYNWSEAVSFEVSLCPSCFILCFEGVALYPVSFDWKSWQSMKTKEEGGDG